MSYASLRRFVASLQDAVVLEALPAEIRDEAELGAVQTADDGRRSETSESWNVGTEISALCFMASRPLCRKDCERCC